MWEKGLKIAFLYLTMVYPYLLIFSHEENIAWLCREDGPVENLSALLFLIASGSFMYTYALSSGPRSRVQGMKMRRNLVYLALAFLLFISFAEEISWGQRVFGWQTPELLSTFNVQNEINIHNIWLFQGTHNNESRRSILTMVLNLHRLFTLFWLVFFLFLPLLAKISFPMGKVLSQLGMPLVPLWIGFLFLFHAIVFHVVYNYVANLPYTILKLHELKECIYAFIVVILAYHELKKTATRHLQAQSTLSAMLIAW